MYMLTGLRTLFLKALTHELTSHEKLHLIDEWNKECDKVFEYKNEIVSEYKRKTAPKVGTWEPSTRGFGFAGDYECSICHSPSGIKHFYNSTKYQYCPDCGAKMNLED